MKSFFMLPISRVIHKEQTFSFRNLYISEKQNDAEKSRYGYIQKDKVSYGLFDLGSRKIDKFSAFAHICRLRSDGVILEYVGLNKDIHAAFGWTECEQKEPRVFPESEYESISYDVFSDYNHAEPVILRLSNVELANQIPWSMVSGEFYIVIDDRSKDCSRGGPNYQFDAAESNYHRTPVTLYVKK